MFYADFTQKKEKVLGKEKRGGEIDKKGGGEWKIGKERREGGGAEQKGKKRGGIRKKSELNRERKKHVGKCACVQKLF